MLGVLPAPSVASQGLEVGQQTPLQIPMGYGILSCGSDSSGLTAFPKVRAHFSGRSWDNVLLRNGKALARSRCLRVIGAQTDPVASCFDLFQSIGWNGSVLVHLPEPC